METGKICPVCNTEINEFDAVKVCPDCGVAHHESCWNQNYGCATFGCPGQDVTMRVAPAMDPAPVAAPAEAEKAFCQNCGTALNAAQAFCPNCGTPKAAAPAANVCVACGTQLRADQTFCPNCGTQQGAAQAAPQMPQKNLCGKCGHELREGQEFCPICGQKAGLVMDHNTNAAINQFNAEVEQKSKSKAPLIIGLVAGGVVTLILLLVFAFSGKTVLEEAYDLHCTSSVWSSISSNGKVLTIDTNPYDWDDDGVAYLDAYYAIEDVNDELGLPYYLFDDMGETRGVDGVQTRYYDDITVTWSYHPDEGLEVTYRLD